MIKLVRVDERLVHGQVAVSWTKFLGVNRIIVADDEASENETQKIAMNMAVPEGTKLSVVPVEKAVSLLNDPRAAKLSIFVVVRNPENALTLINNVKDIPKINFGNYGRMSEGDSSDKIKLEANLYVTDAELETIKEIIGTNVPTKYQTVPSEKEFDLKSMIK
ncbi:PTS system mannose/fructose/N-acetylgalactosamine-transporter subunit IIB [Vagococcus elongatus]|uniref:PTS system mannose/fructose/N-acetylgalactosamine-transporter subunit IIB n=1 Tax=Vagococcus elongatus TaxID=180344 RepID=UPI00147696A0|nr:PTS sugar transporter subunit IIB [Vagococcus elongatus]